MLLSLIFTSTFNVFSFHLSPSTRLLVYSTTFSLVIVSKEHRKHLDTFQTALNLALGLQPRNQQRQHCLGTAWRKAWPEPHIIPLLHPQEKVSYAESFGGCLHARIPGAESMRRRLSEKPDVIVKSLLWFFALTFL